VEGQRNAQWRQRLGGGCGLAAAESLLPFFYVGFSLLEEERETFSTSNAEFSC